MYKTHAVVNINSAELSSGTIEDFRTELAIQIKLRPGVRYLVRAENIKIATSFAHQNSNYNTMTFTETDGVTPHELSITITEGSYTILELITQIEIDMDAASLAGGDSNTYVLTYDSITGLVSISFSGGSSTSVTFDSGPLIDQLGFVAGDVIATSLTGIMVAYTQTIRFVNIHSNLPLSNYYNKIGLQRIIAHVPILETRYQFNYFKNDSGGMIQINSENIYEIESRLRDDSNKILDMRGIDYSYQLVFYREKSFGMKLTDMFKSILGLKSKK
jgi:hypothetical protein